MASTTTNFWRILIALGTATTLAACGDGTTGPSSVALPGTLPIEAPVDDDCFEAVAGSRTIECEGLSAELSVPERCLENACGLIVDVHGFGMNGFTQNLHTRLDPLATDQGFIVLQPSAPRGDGGFSSWSAENDAQVVGMIERIRRSFHVMDERIHMTGYSQGGFMTWRFTCDRSELLASVAPIGGSSGDCFDSKTPAREVPILYAHGVTDGLVPFEGALATAHNVVRTWNMKGPEVIDGDEDYRWVRYRSPAGTPFEFVDFDWETPFVLGNNPLRGHCFPGSDQFVGCGPDTSFKWGEEIVRFFLAHPKGR
jgi:poly(3-hydroxybutyrate) depolymerase